MTKRQTAESVKSSPGGRPGAKPAAVIAPKTDARQAEDMSKRKKKRIAYLVFTAVTALMVIVMAIVLRGVSDLRSYNEYMERAQGYYSAGEIDSALICFRKAANIDATDECLLLIANCYETQGNYSSAIDTLKRISDDGDAVKQRISSLEERLARMSETGMVTIAGSRYSAGTTGIALDRMELTDAVLEEIGQLYSLSNLSLAGNQLSDITALSAIGGLTTLNLNNNSISNIAPLASLTSLRTLYLDNNPITDLTPLYSLTNLTTLSIKGIGVTESQLSEISATLPNCAIHSETAEAEAQDISLGGVTFKSDVTELNLSGMGIRDASALSVCKNLTKLDLSGNALSDLSSVMDIPGLTWLNISANNISDLRPLMGMTTLRYVNVSSNNVGSTVPLSSLRSLTELYLDSNPITNFTGLRKLYNLQTLSINSVGLDSDDLGSLSGLSSLLSLSMLDNPGLTGEGVDALRQTIPACTITTSELTYTIDVDGYAISTEATELDLSGCGITDISSVTRLDHLTYVNLARNNINNIYPFQYSNSMTNITYLDLSSNFLEDITAVAGMTSLTTLDISYNNVSLISPLMSLTNLRTLRLTGNPMTAEQIAEIQTALPFCEIISQ